MAKKIKPQITIEGVRKRLLDDNCNMSEVARAVGVTPQAIWAIAQGGDVRHCKTFLPLVAYFEKLDWVKS